MKHYIDEILNDARTGNLFHQKLTNVEEQYLRDFYKSTISNYTQLSPNKMDEWCEFVDGINTENADQILALNTAYEIIVYNIKNCKEYLEQKEDEYIKLQVLEEDLFIRKGFHYNKKEIESLRQQINDCNKSNEELYNSRKETFAEIVKCALYIADSKKYETITEEHQK